jgi:hypothetical protein
MMEHYLELLGKTPEFVEEVGDSGVLNIVKMAVQRSIETQKRYGEYIRHIFRACAHRSFFCTQRGYMGLAPWNAQQGDLVCVLKGGRTPFLLRLMPGVGQYRLVGEAFVFGIMGGEALDMGHVGGWKSFELV